MARNGLHVRRGGRAVTAALLALPLLTLPLLSGCAGPTPFSDFDRERDDRDVLPDLGEISSGIDPDSVRYAGSAEGLDVYLGLSSETGDRCVVIDAEPDGWSACGGGGLETSRPGAFVVQVHPDGAAPEDSPGIDWTPLGENVSVRSDEPWSRPFPTASPTAG